MAFRLATDAKPPGWHEERLATRRLPVLVMAPGWQETLDRGAGVVDFTRIFMHVSRERLRDEILLPYLKGRRWFAAKNEPIADLRVASIAPWKGESGNTWRIAFVDATLASGEAQRYFLPIALDWETRDHDPSRNTRPSRSQRCATRIASAPSTRRSPTPTSHATWRVQWEATRRRPSARAASRSLRTARFAALSDALDEPSRTPALEQSNTAVFFGSKLFLKGYRRLRPGVNPELELGRFLTEVSPFPHIAPVLGAVEYQAPSAAEPSTLAILQQFVENQGDLWTLTCQHLGRALRMPSDRCHDDRTRGRGRVGGRRVPSWPHGAPRPAHRRDARAPVRDHRRRALRSGAGDGGDLAGWKARSSASSTRHSPRSPRPFRARRSGASRSRARGRGTREDPRARGRGHREDRRPREDALSRRPAPGTSAGGAGRLHHRRLRGRARALDRGAAREIERAARRRGMLRSFSYATHAALLRREPGSDASGGGAQALAQWESEARRHFLEGYQKAAQGVASVPRIRIVPRIDGPFPPGEGAVRAALRDRQPPRLGRDPGARLLELAG
jgi:hypothetical protein